MDKDLEKEIVDLINKTVTNKKAQFGKQYSELGTVDSNLVLRTKGDVKIQWGGKYIDLIKDGKINAQSEFPIKKINTESAIGQTKGVYITADKKVLIGNKNDYTVIETEQVSFPENTLFLCESPETPIQDIKIQIQLPALVVTDGTTVIGNTVQQTIDIPLSQILVNSNQYSWTLQTQDKSN